MATVDLDQGELGDAAAACQALSFQEGERAKAMNNPDMHLGFEENSKRFAHLARKCEMARRLQTESQVRP